MQEGGEYDVSQHEYRRFVVWCSEGGGMNVVLFGGGGGGMKWCEACTSKEGKHPRGNPGANLKSISHRCHPILVAFVWELTKEIIDLPLGCLQGGGEVMHEEGCGEGEE